MYEAYIPLAQLIFLLGEVQGRKKLQKMVYLAQRLGAPFREDFAYYLFGPFSEALANELEEMKMLGLIKETKETTQGGYSQYSYSLTEEGTEFAKSKQLVFDSDLISTLQELNKEDGRQLELKATTWFLLESRLPDGEVPKMIRELKADQKYRNDEINESLSWVKWHLKANSQKYGARKATAIG